MQSPPFSSARKEPPLPCPCPCPDSGLGPSKSNPNISAVFVSWEPLFNTQRLRVSAAVSERKRKCKKIESTVFWIFSNCPNIPKLHPFLKPSEALTDCIKTRLKEAQTPWNGASMTALLHIYMSWEGGGCFTLTPKHCSFLPPHVY